MTVLIEVGEPAVDRRGVPRGVSSLPWDMLRFLVGECPFALLDFDSSGNMILIWPKSSKSSKSDIKLLFDNFRGVEAVCDCAEGSEPFIFLRWSGSRDE